MIPKEIQDKLLEIWGRDVDELEPYVETLPANLRDPAINWLLGAILIPSGARNNGSA